MWRDENPFFSFTSALVEGVRNPLQPPHTFSTHFPMLLLPGRAIHCAMQDVFARLLRFPKAMDPRRSRLTCDVTPPPKQTIFGANFGAEPTDPPNVGNPQAEATPWGPGQNPNVSNPKIHAKFRESQPHPTNQTLTGSACLPVSWERGEPGEVVDPPPNFSNLWLKFRVHWRGCLNLDQMVNKNIFHFCLFSQGRREVAHFF